MNSFYVGAPRGEYCYSLRPVIAPHTAGRQPDASSLPPASGFLYGPACTGCCSIDHGTKQCPVAKAALEVFLKGNPPAMSLVVFEVKLSWLLFLCIDIVSSLDPNSDLIFFPDLTMPCPSDCLPCSCTSSCDSWLYC